MFKLSEIIDQMIENPVLYEGLIYSHNINGVVNHLSKWATCNDKFNISVNDNKIELVFYKNIDQEEFDDLVTMVNNLGWYISSYLGILKNEVDNQLKWKKLLSSNMNDFSEIYQFQLESKFGQEVDKYGIKTLYHVSSTIHRKKILKIGLCPKAKEKISSHPDRIYFVQDKSDVKSIAKQFNKINKKWVEFNIYDINVKKLVQSQSIRFFADPNFIGGIFTLSNIPPSLLKLIDTIKI